MLLEKGREIEQKSYDSWLDALTFFSFYTDTIYYHLFRTKSSDRTMIFSSEFISNDFIIQHCTEKVIYA